MTADELIKFAKLGLKNNDIKPSRVLTRTFEMLFEPRKDIYWIVGKLLKTYKPEVVLDSIINLYDGEKNLEKSLYVQLVGICRRIEKQSMPVESALVSEIDFGRYFGEVGN